MTNIKPVVVDVSGSPGGSGDGSALQVTWGPFANVDVLLPIQLPKHSDHSIHISGTLGAAGTVTLLGSNNGGASFGALHDTAGVAISMTTTDTIKQVLENCMQLKPVWAGGDGTTAAVVSILFHFSNPARQ